MQIAYFRVQPLRIKDARKIGWVVIFEIFCFTQFFPPSCGYKCVYIYLDLFQSGTLYISCCYPPIFTGTVLSMCIIRQISDHIIIKFIVIYLFPPNQLKSQSCTVCKFVVSKDSAQKTIFFSKFLNVATRNPKCWSNDFVEKLNQIVVLGFFTPCGTW